MFHLTYSNMAQFKDCPMRFKLSVIEGLRPIVESNALVLGRAFHLFRESGWEPVEEMFTEKRKAISTQEEADQLEISWAILRGMSLVSPEDSGVVREVEWDNPLINPATGAPSKSFRLAGKADGIWRTGTETCALIEEKTTGASVTQSMIDKLSIDTQILNAIVNLEDKGEPKVEEVWYRYFRKPSIKQKQTETVTQYCDRVVDDYHARPEFYHHEERLRFPRSQLDAYRADLWQVGKSILYTRRFDLFYTNTSHCLDYGRCPYLPICRGDATEGLYKVRETNPELGNEEAHSSDFFTE